MKLDFKKIKFKKKKTTSKAKESRKLKFDKKTLYGVFCYLNFLVLIPIMFKNNDLFVSYHIKQGFFLLFVWLLFAFSFYIPVLFWIFGAFVLVLTVIGIKNVVLRKQSPILPMPFFAKEW